MKICHITTVHPRNDVRIFHKECKSLSEKFTDVSLIVADGKGDQVIDGVKIYDIGNKSGRFSRFFKTVNRAKNIALEINADIYHIHDPELLRISCKLGYKKVFYDAHEDVPRQILSKYYIPKLFRKMISKLFEKYETRVCRKLAGILTATEHIKQRFLKINPNTTDINNFPIITDIAFQSNWTVKEKSIAYIGGIFETRGIFQMLESVKDTDISLHLGGYFSPKELEEKCKLHKGWQNVIFHGFIKRNKVNDFFKKVSAGIVILEATPSYICSMPVKMFEYMASGIPVIASDFPLWRRIIETNNCGICVNQENIQEVKQKTRKLLNDKALCEKMGKNGRRAVETKYNWDIEKEKLFEFYNNHYKCK